MRVPLKARLTHLGATGRTRTRACVLLLAALWLLCTAAPGQALPASVRSLTPAAEPQPGLVRRLRMLYRTSTGLRREAIVLIPGRYRPRGAALPLVIAPHGRGVTARATCDLWGTLPAVGRFAVVCPAGHGTRLRLNSWAAAPEIRDLAAMPALVQRAFPWLRVDQRRIYAVGGSMGGEETLLLLARYPHLLAGAIAFDAVADLALQYGNALRIPCNALCRSRWGEPIGLALREEMRREVGSTPRIDPLGYALRSPLHYVPEIAHSGVPLELWWSVSDRIVRDQAAGQSGRLFDRVLAAGPHARIEAFIGDWIHSTEQRAGSRLPFALAQLGLMPARYLRRPDRLIVRHFIPRRLFERRPRLRVTVIHVAAGRTFEFAFRLSRHVVPSGLIVFEVRNDGRLRHRFKLCLPEGTYGDYCRGAETRWLAPGRSTRLVVPLVEGGTYRYECAVPGHTDAGMKGDLRVRW